MVEELQRLSSENKRLSERLSQMCENYNLLQKQLRQLVVNTNNNNNSEKMEQTHQSRKRKADSENCMANNITECSTIISEEESYKRPKDHTTSKVSKVLVRTEPSDTSLVSNSIVSPLSCDPNFLCFFLLKSYSLLDSDRIKRLITTILKVIAISYYTILFFRAHHTNIYELTDSTN